MGQHIEKNYVTMELNSIDLSLKLYLNIALLCPTYSIEMNCFAIICAQTNDTGMFQLLINTYDVHRNVAYERGQSYV